MKAVVVSLLAVFGLISCAEFNEQRTEQFQDSIWSVDEKIGFSPQVSVDRPYQIELTVSYLFNKPMTNFPIVVKLIDASGAVENEYLLSEMFIEGKADCSGDYCEVVNILDSDYSFKSSGAYYIEVSQSFGAVPRVSSVRVKLK